MEETARASVKASYNELSYTGPEMEPVVAPGTSDVCTGSSSTELRCTPPEVYAPVSVEPGAEVP